MDCKKLGRLILFSTRIALRAVHLCFLSMKAVISIDYDMFLSFVLLMGGRGGLFTAVDCCISMMHHNVMDDLGVDDRGIWSGLSWCEQ